VPVLARVQSARVVIEARRIASPRSRFLQR
jgi:hypothetical protein